MDKKSDTFSGAVSLPLLDRFRSGEKEAEREIQEILLPVLCEEYQAGPKSPRVEDAIQEIEIRLLGEVGKKTGRIKNTKIYIESVARHFLRSEHKKESAKKRGGIDVEEVGTGRIKRIRRQADSLESREAIAREAGGPPPQEGDRAWGEDDAGPEELAGRRDSRGADAIAESYMALPGDLRAGIEKSLDLIADLFRTNQILREKLRRGSKDGRRILKAIGSIERALKAVSRTCRPAPREKDLMRLYEIRELSGPYTFSGIPEKDKEMDARLAEETDLSKKYEAAYLLFEAKRNLSAKILNPELELLLTPPQYLDVPVGEKWINHLVEIAGMKVSPGAIILKVWSRASGFRKGKRGKYQDRKSIGAAIRYHKLASKGTPREFLFSAIRDVREMGNHEEVLSELERFRKAGYGQPLKKKYRPLIELIFNKSFGPSAARQVVR